MYPIVFFNDLNYVCGIHVYSNKIVRHHFWRVQVSFATFSLQNLFPFFSHNKMYQFIDFLVHVFLQPPKKGCVSEVFLHSLGKKKHKHKKSKGFKSRFTQTEMVDHLLILNPPSNKNTNLSFISHPGFRVTTGMKFPFVSMEFQSKPSLNSTIAS